MVSKKLQSAFAEAGFELGSDDEEDLLTMNGGKGFSGNGEVESLDEDGDLSEVDDGSISDENSESGSEKDDDNNDIDEEELPIPSRHTNLPSRVNIAKPSNSTPHPKNPSSQQKPELKQNKTSQKEETNEYNESENPISNASSFADLGLDNWLIDSLRSLSITTPTEIQSACIPKIMSGRDVIGSAKTGSGKTATFALPMLQKLAKDPFGVFGLVLTPTRELAFQIAEQFRVLGAGMVKQTVVVGGLDMITQSISLQSRPHIVIATPGRLVDHLNTHPELASIFQNLRYLVLDEADRLFDASFHSDLEVLFNYLPDPTKRPRQTLLFSATMTPEIENLSLSKDANKRPFVYRCNERFETVSKLVQRYLFVPTLVHEANLIWLLTSPEVGILADLATVETSDSKSKSKYKSKPKSKPVTDGPKRTNKTVIIFVNKCETCEYLRVLLKELDIPSTALHSSMNQNERISSLAKFKSGVVPVLVSTDVGSRGLDIPSVHLVLNYDIPFTPADYIHRIGRTARAGKGGQSITLITQDSLPYFLKMEEQLPKKLDQMLPEGSDEDSLREKWVVKELARIALAKRVARLWLLDTKFGEKKKLNQEKLKRKWDAVAAAEEVDEKKKKKTLKKKVKKPVVA